MTDYDKAPMVTSSFRDHETAEHAYSDLRSRGYSDHDIHVMMSDDTRKRIALRYVAGHDLGLAEVALLSGFTETPSFYRAFRRWTGMTPSKYRWTHRGDLRGLR